MRTKSVRDLFEFDTMDGEEWTEEEQQPFYDMMQHHDNVLRARLGIVPSEPTAYLNGWHVVKRSGEYGPKFWAWRWTWQGSSWGTDTAREMAHKIDRYHGDPEHGYPYYFAD